MCEFYLDKVIDVMIVLYVDVKLDIKIEICGGLIEIIFVLNDFFSVYKWEVDGVVEFVVKVFYMLVSVLDGEVVFMIDGIK